MYIPRKSNQPSSKHVICVNLHPAQSGGRGSHTTPSPWRQPPAHNRQRHQAHVRPLLKSVFVLKWSFSVSTCQDKQALKEEKRKPPCTDGIARFIPPLSAGPTTPYTQRQASFSTKTTCGRPEGISRAPSGAKGPEGTRTHQKQLVHGVGCLGNCTGYGVKVKTQIKWQQTLM